MHFSISGLVNPGTDRSEIEQDFSMVLIGSYKDFFQQEYGGILHLALQNLNLIDLLRSFSQEDSA